MPGSGRPRPARIGFAYEDVVAPASEQDRAADEERGGESEPQPAPGSSLRSKRGA
jgi:hypothetical protein